VVRQAHHEVYFEIEVLAALPVSVALILSLSKDGGVARLVARPRGSTGSP